MKFLIITHVPHKVGDDGKIYGYGPYVREMNLWLKYVDSVLVISPITTEAIDPIDLPYEHNDLRVKVVPAFDLTSMSSLLMAVLRIPSIVLAMIKGMRWCDHIHIRCPGNMGLLGCLVQIFFPNKKKTAKYAANWDWNSIQPWSYRLQQRLMRSPFLSRNMKAMVYGEWSDKTRNVETFFTATYFESEKEMVQSRNFDNEVRLVFVGRLIKGKNPLMAVAATKELTKKGFNVSMDVIGDGPQMNLLTSYVESSRLEDSVRIRGNLDKDTLKHILQSAHFLIFPTVMAEGWPKVVAESMFWGCVPVTTRVSCVPSMLGDGSRGTLIDASVGGIVSAIEGYFNNIEKYTQHSRNAWQWSQEYTLEKFESKIVELLFPTANGDE